jgi:hypothetical protein
MIVRAKDPRTALQIPKRKRKPSTNQAAMLKQITAIMNVKKPDNKSKVIKVGAENTKCNSGRINAVTIPRANAPKKAFLGVSISTPKGNLLIINKLIDVTNQTINSDPIFITTTPEM